MEVVFALRDRQELLRVSVDPGTTVQEAIERSSIAERFPEWRLDDCTVGIWGHPVDRDTTVKDGDRVEIYRELRIEPRDARRKLARAGKTMKSGEGAGD